MDEEKIVFLRRKMQDDPFDVHDGYRELFLLPFECRVILAFHHIVHSIERDFEQDRVSESITTKIKGACIAFAFGHFRQSNADFQRCLSVCT